MRKIAALMLASATWLAGCELSHGEGNTSGSNWLRCKQLSECGAAEAVSCSGDGFCTNQDGERIETLSKPTGGDAGPRDAAATDGDAGPLDAAAADSGCAWGVSEALAKVGASAPERENCGYFGGSSLFWGPRDCFYRNVSEGRAVELTVNGCVDCSIPTTYVATSSGAIYAIRLEDDAFGDASREVRVEACDVVDMPFDGMSLSCGNPRELYECSEPRSIARATPTHPPVTPYRVANVPNPDAKATVPLHLYISNQSFDEPLVDITVRLDDMEVVVGSFDVKGGHNWILFEFDAPLGTHRLDVNSPGHASLNRSIDIAAERWLVVDYWANQSDGSKPLFTLNESDMPVAFN